MLPIARVSFELFLGSGPEGDDVLWYTGEKFRPSVRMYVRTSPPCPGSGLLETGWGLPKAGWGLLETGLGL